MRARLPRRLARACVIVALVALAAGCAGGGYGYGYGYASDDVGVGYFEPYGGDYGGWGRGYRVGPVRGGGHGFPSIPSRGRGGFGGGHANAGGGGHH
jgi:hypothetical protein